MARAIVFFITTGFFLLLLDVQVIFLRVFNRAGLEPFLNRWVRTWGHGIICNGKLLLGMKHRDETPRAMRERLPAQFICLANHQSFFDITVVFDLFADHQMRFVAKKALGRFFPGVSQTLRYQRHALIDQAGNARANHEVITRYARRAYQKGYCPVIFPEGTRSRTGELGVFQAAGLRMILDQGTLPLVVVAIDGGWEMATMKDYFSSSPKRFRVKILDVLPAPANKEDTRLALARSRELIAAQLEAWRSGRE